MANFIVSVLSFGAFFLVLTAGQNTQQVQQRVLERVDYYMSRPVEALTVWSNFYDMGGFPNDLGATDRDIAAIYLYSILRSSNNSYWKPFYGLENGLFLGFVHSQSRSVPVLSYREPGNSGYIPDDEGMGIYYNTCINEETGDGIPCALTDGNKYISCINDCELVKCDDLDSQYNCSDLSDEAREECESKVIWCSNYTVKQTNEGIRLGFVPRSRYCYDSKGTFSQTPGEILTETESGTVELGDCTFESGTLVERQLSGPYANCGGDGIICNTTYIGAYQSIDYDPRLKSWYTASKATRHPRWSDPYVFTNIEEIGVTYTHPLNSTDSEGRTIFSGVLAADIRLGDISNFLVEAFDGTDFAVAIYEADVPYYMIGISTGGQIFEKVSAEDPTQPCSNEQADRGDCTMKQLTINDLEDNPEEVILKRAHFALEKEGFDPDQVASVKETDEVGSTAYLATFVNYEQPNANLNWRIIVTLPLERDSEDTITEGETLYTAVWILGGLGFFVCLGLVVLFFWNRNERAIMLADFKFTSAFIFFCALMNLSSLTLLGENTDELCMLRMWAYYQLSALALSPLFVKAFRTWKLLGASPSSAGKNKRMNNYQAWIRTVPIPLCQAAILTTFSIADPPRATENINYGGPLPVQSITCEHNSNAFVVTQGVLYCLMIAVGCILAYLTRNIDPRFADAKALVFAMYNIAFTAIMFGAIYSVVEATESSINMMTAIGVFWVTVFSSIVFVVPKVMAAKNDRRKTRERLMKLRASQKHKATKRVSSVAGFSMESLHESEETLKVLICSANIGNAEPTLSSMKAWIPEGGNCFDVTTLDGELIDAERFDLIVIGMQESTWSSKKMQKQKQKRMIFYVNEGEDEDEDEDADEEHNYLAAVEGTDTVLLRKMTKNILGRDYSLVAEEIRGQMRLYIWALESLTPFLENVRVSGANTGIGNVLANKGGIVISLEYKQTRFSFLCAHLAAHEGESYYQARCENIHDILQNSKTFRLSKKFDLSVTSHHIFVFGDLNFRTRFEEKCGHEENVYRALELIIAEDFAKLYSYDELHKGIEKEELLVGFKTLPCLFYPTFKVEREPGYVYREERTPSYTDRILFKSAVGLNRFVKPLAYEPCVDFITSDHKPIRGAFSIAPNEIIEPTHVEWRFRMVFSEMECSDLPAGDVDGFSDPFLLFVWDSIEMAQEKMRGFRLPNLFSYHSWPRTNYISKTLNPKWKGKEIILVSLGHEVSNQATLYISVFDFDFGAKDDVLGTLPLNIMELVNMRRGQNQKVMTFDRRLQANGRYHGRIKFKLEITTFIG